MNTLAMPVGEPERIAVAFARVLRGAGVDVPVGATLTYANALSCVGLADRAGVYWAGRATLLTRPELIATYDRAFDAFWSATVRGADDSALPVTEVVVALDAPPPRPRSGRGDDDEQPDAPVISVRWSPAEVLRRRDFAAYTPAEFVEARRLDGGSPVRGRHPPVAAAPSRTPVPGRTRRAPDSPARVARRRRARAARVPRAVRAVAPRRAAPRRQRIDGAVSRARSCGSCTPRS